MIHQKAAHLLTLQAYQDFRQAVLVADVCLICIHHCPKSTVPCKKVSRIWIRTCEFLHDCCCLSAELWHRNVVLVDPIVSLQTKSIQAALNCNPATDLAAWRVNELPIEFRDPAD